jgi:hypothetical protein
LLSTRLIRNLFSRLEAMGLIPASKNGTITLLILGKKWPPYWETVMMYGMSS